MNLTRTLHTRDELPQLARELIGLLQEYPVVALQGDLGAGKTTLVHAMCLADGVVDDVINSPTFAIVNDYTTRDGRTIYHADCYRLDTIADADRIGMAEYVRSGCRCYIEWPEVIAPLLPEDTAIIHLSVCPDGSRRCLIDLPD